MNTPYDRIAEAYVKLVLAVGQHDTDSVDAFYGPPEWAATAKSAKRPAESIHTEASALLSDLEKLPLPSEEILRLRHQYLQKQLSSLRTRVEILGGRHLSFDDEAAALYDAAPPTFPEEHFQSLIGEIATIVPGNGPVPERIEQFRRKFIIPTHRLDAVFLAAIDECRSRTKKHIPLPPGESFRVEYVTNKSWSGYNWYQGQSRSLIQMNTDLPIFLERAIDLAAHEGYPGHHVYNSLLERELVRTRGWMEFSVYALFSPQSLIAEGTANFGIEVAFTAAERLTFERDVLFPLAGLDPSEAERYARLQSVIARLTYAGNEAARRYLDGAFTREQATDWLVRYALMSPERAMQRTRFFDQYRSYVINYNLGQDLVKRYVESRGGGAENAERRWQEFAQLISSPRLPSGLR